jgi:hypothetical protein
VALFERSVGVTEAIRVRVLFVLGLTAINTGDPPLNTAEKDAEDAVVGVVTVSVVAPLWAFDPLLLVARREKVTERDAVVPTSV